MKLRHLYAFNLTIFKLQPRGCSKNSFPNTIEYHGERSTKPEIFNEWLLRKCIPTRSNLRKKNILYPLHCVCCDSNIENEWHLFLACDHARLIWQAADLWNLAEHRWDNADNFHDFIHIKCNLDAALLKDSQTFGIGMCLRDSQGNFIKAKSATIQEHPKPEVAEAWALHQSINWIKRSTTPERDF
ncbi:hypothetical protein JHK84_049015 [Glycine max]|uniref:Reverse transcriptase zinc-binding domain-containing protein n=2 Tax=Glycine subgen. Soja TaxID=1462606 RepID=A0A0R0EUK1_SOYBN|nr:hypothetical protein JHK87_048764 [Glycine soja]KAG5093427.1 hypothetical protein JHK84_049015 [Glycine max]RZB50261.1 hypothetical protein D0Y65_047266 [Glycine soja]